MSPWTMNREWLLVLCVAWCTLVTGCGSSGAPCTPEKIAHDKAVCKVPVSVVIETSDSTQVTGYIAGVPANSKDMYVRLVRVAKGYQNLDDPSAGEMVPTDAVLTTAPPRSQSSPGFKFDARVITDNQCPMTGQPPGTSLDMQLAPFDAYVVVSFGSSDSSASGRSRVFQVQSDWCYGLMN